MGFNSGFKGLSTLLTPYSRVLLEKLTGFQLVKKFPAFYEIRRFITAVKSANIKYSNTKFNHPGDFAAGICAPLLHSCFSSALNRTIWTSYMKAYTTHPTRITNDSVPCV